MKKPFLLKSAFGLLAILLAPASHAKESAEVLAQIKRIENGLLPYVALKDQRGVTQNLQQRMAAYGTPGISVAVVEGGKLLWARSYGVKETGSNQRVTNDTLFLAGSISKPVAALGALTLVKDGRILLDEDVNAHLKSWKIPNAAVMADEKVTLRRLLSHTAGTTVHGFPGYDSTAKVPTLLQILNGELPANTPPIRVDLKPGTRYRYSGGGYTIMQQLVIDLSGKSFESYMQSAVLRPLGMKNSTYSQVLSKRQLAKRATAHRPGGQPIPGKTHVYPEMAAAGLWTTASDLAQYIVYVQKAAHGRDHRLLTSALIQQMLTKQNGDHGLGPQLAGDAAALRFSHGGVDEGFEALLIGYVHGGQGAVVLGNSNLSQMLMRELIGSIAKEYQWLQFPTNEQLFAAPMQQTQLQRVPGKYYFDPFGEVTIVARDARLFVQSATRGEVELFARDEETLFSPFLGIRSARIVIDSAGRVLGLQVPTGDIKRLE